MGCSSSVQRSVGPTELKATNGQVAAQDELSQQKDESRRAPVLEASEKSINKNQSDGEDDQKDNKSVSEVKAATVGISNGPSQQAKTIITPPKEEKTIVNEPTSKKDAQPTHSQTKAKAQAPKDQSDQKDDQKDKKSVSEVKAATVGISNGPNQQAKTTITPPKEEKTIVNESTSKKDAQPTHSQTKAKAQAPKDQSDENSSKGSKRMTRDTYEYLLEYGKNLPANEEGRQLPFILAKCFEGEVTLLISGKNETYYFRDVFAKLVEDTFTRMCEATKPEEKTKWRTRMFNIIEVVNSTHFADVTFEKIPRAAENLKREYPVTEEAPREKVKIDIEDFDDVAGKKLNLTSFFSFEARDLIYNKEDYDFEFQKGEGLAILSERRAVKKVLQRAKELKEEYYKTIGNVLTSNGGEHFKCGSKSYLRTEAKLNELAAEKKERPVFKHLFDSLRCKAHFMKPEDLEKAYVAISSQFKVIRLKNKINSHLKNITLNLVYKDIISEVQLVLGAPQAESENHILYEIERTRSFAELYEVVEGWGGFDFTEFEPLKGDIVEIHKPNVEEKWVIIGNTRYKLLRSKEYGIDLTNLGSNPLTYFDESAYFKKSEGEVKIRYSKQGLYLSVCEDFPVPKVSDYPEEFLQYQPAIVELYTPENYALKEKDDTICKVDVFMDWLQIKGLTLYSKKGQVIKLGTIEEDQKIDFTFKAPENAQIAAFGGKMDLNSQRLLSLYCWIATDEEKIKTGYQGDMQNGVPHGKGVMIYPDGLQYTGEWKNNKKNGKGVLIDAKGEMVYEGDWVDDIKHGQGRYSYAPQEWYKGSWKNDKRDGMGQYSCSDQGLHCYGLWKNDKLNGTGTIISSSAMARFSLGINGECKGVWEDNYCKHSTLWEHRNVKYSGGFFLDTKNKALVPHGRGVYSERTWGMGYGVGEWDHGKGKGKFLYTDETARNYEGEFENFKTTDNGTTHYLGGAKLVGSFHRKTVDNRSYHSDGAIIEGTNWDPDSWKFYASGESKPIKMKANSKLGNTQIEDSYYHAPTSTLYYVYRPLRFKGKAVNFTEDSGKGTWYLTNGQKIDGSWKIEDGNTGTFGFQGTIKYLNGNAFEGIFKAYVLGQSRNINLLQGTLTYKNGNKLEGKWEDNDLEEYFEKGTLFYSNGDKFVGSWSRGRLDEGEFHLSNGKKLDFKSDKKYYKASNNKVISFGKEGERFELDWDMELPDEKKIVKGTCFYLNGDRYEGEIRTPNKIHGKGVLYYVNGDKFEGLWNHHKDGSGRKGKHFVSNELVLDEEFDGRDFIVCDFAANK